MVEDREVQVGPAAGSMLTNAVEAICSPMEGPNPKSIDGHHLGGLYMQAVAPYLSGLYNPSCDNALKNLIQRVGNCCVNVLRKHGSGLKRGFTDTCNRDYLAAIHQPVWGGMHKDVVWKAFYE